MQGSRLLSHCPTSPSFGSFSTTVDLAAIAARVVEEFRNLDPESDSFPHPSDIDPINDDDFEFVFHCSVPHPDSIATADEIFCNGQIRPLYPYSLSTSGCGDGRSMVGDAKAETESMSSPPPIRHHRPALKKLMSEERDLTSSSEQADDEDLIGVPRESYCVWTPKRTAVVDGDGGKEECCQVLSSSSSSSRCKIKSSSAGSSSKRWKFRELLYVRSNSDGKEKFVLLAPIKKIAKTSILEEKAPAKEPSRANQR